MSSVNKSDFTRTLESPTGDDNYNWHTHKLPIAIILDEEGNALYQDRMIFSVNTRTGVIQEYVLDEEGNVKLTPSGRYAMYFESTIPLPIILLFKDQ